MKETAAGPAFSRGPRTWAPLRAGRFSTRARQKKQSAPSPDRKQARAIPIRTCGCRHGNPNSAVTRGSTPRERPAEETHRRSFKFKAIAPTFRPRGALLSQSCLSFQETFSTFAIPAYGKTYFDESVSLLSLARNLVNFKKTRETAHSSLVSAEGAPLSAIRVWGIVYLFSGLPEPLVR